MEMSKKLGLILYWADGDKSQDYFVALTNTSPEILKYFSVWLRKYFIIDENKLRCRLYIWSNLDEIKAKNFWSKQLKVPINQFTKSYISKTIPKVRKIRHLYGVCRLSYGSKKIFNEIDEGIRKHFY
jgi:hypothetical protein